MNHGANPNFGIMPSPNHPPLTTTTNNNKKKKSQLSLVYDASYLPFYYNIPKIQWMPMGMYLQNIIELPQNMNTHTCIYIYTYNEFNFPS